MSAIFDNLVNVATLTADVVRFISTFFQWLPVPVIAVIVAIFAVVVVYKVLGREG